MEGIKYECSCGVEADVELNYGKFHIHTDDSGNLVVRCQSCNRTAILLDKSEINMSVDVSSI